MPILQVQKDGSDSQGPWTSHSQF